jgi:anthranilate/para-aminobenzoate synthase component II
MKKIKLLMVDNYDSFTYNIVQYFGELGADIEVFRNDEIDLEGIAQRKPDRLVISPGLAHPQRPAFLWQPFSTLPVSCPFWECVWATKALALHWVARLCAHKN